jgi:hypothetical protein
MQRIFPLRYSIFNVTQPTTRALSSHSQAKSLSDQWVKRRAEEVSSEISQDMATMLKSAYVYRGEYRSPAQLYVSNGLIPGNKNLSLLHHATKSLKRHEGVAPYQYESSGYVSTTVSFKTARNFADRTRRPERTLYQLQRPVIHAAFYADIEEKFTARLSTHAVRNELELAAVGPIPFHDIHSFASWDGETYGPWWKNTTHYQPRDYSITIRSADNAEANEFGKDLPYFYPSYSVALKIADMLSEASKLYKSETSYMTCFESLKEQAIEKTLQRKAGSGFDESDLLTYYEISFHQVQKEMKRKVKSKVFVTIPGTLFVEKSGANKNKINNEARSDNAKAELKK